MTNSSRTFVQDTDPAFDAFGQATQHASDMGDYAKGQGDYAKAQGVLSAQQTASQAIGSQAAFAELSTSLRLGVSLGVLPPVSARPPLIERFSQPQYALGTVLGQRGWSIESGTAVLTAAGLVVDSDVRAGKPHGALSPLIFSEGVLRVFVPDPAGGVAIEWGGPTGPGYHFALWKGGGNLETGWWRANADGSLDNVTSRAATPVPGNPYWCEIDMGPNFSGSGYTVRVWNDNAAYPDLPTMTVGFNSSTPPLGEGPIRLASLDSPATYGALIVDDWQRQPNPIEAKVSAVTGPWFNRFEAGQNVLCTITSGAELRGTVKNTGGVGLLLGIPPGMTTRPVVSSRVCPAGGAWSAWTRTPVPNTGSAGGVVRVDPVTNLTPATEYRVELCMIIEENDPLWQQGAGVCVLQVIVADGGQCRPTVEDNLLLIEESGTSIVAAIVADGHYSDSRASHPTVTGTEQSHLHVACDILNAIPYQSGYGGTGVVKAFGSGGVPNAIQNSNGFMQGRNRAYRRKPNITIGEHGVNDSGAGVSDADFRAGYRTWALDRMARNPGTQLILMRPFLGVYEAVIKSLAAELGLLYIDTTGWLDLNTDYGPNDKTHPLRAGQIKAGIKLAAWLVAHGVPVNGASKVAYAA